MKTEFIHRFVPATNGSGRTLLLLHGTGGNEDDLISLGKAIDPEAALLSPRGKILENGAPRFFRRLAEGVFDEEDVVRQSGELAAFIEEAIAEYKIDRAQFVAVGYSNGANIAAAMMLLGVAPFAQAVLLRAMVPLTNLSSEKSVAAGILIAEGRFDPIAPPDQGSKLAERLRGTGATVDLIVQNSGHELVAEDVAQAKRWLLSE